MPKLIGPTCQEELEEFETGQCDPLLIRAPLQAAEAIPGNAVDLVLDNRGSADAHGVDQTTVELS